MVSHSAGDKIKEKNDTANVKKKKKAPKKKKKLEGLPKLVDANEADGPRASECTLILTEGDSAMALAVSGLSVMDQRDLYGVYPLRHVTYLTYLILQLAKYI